MGVGQDEGQEEKPCPFPENRMAVGVGSYKMVITQPPGSMKCYRLVFLACLKDSRAVALTGTTCLFVVVLRSFSALHTAIVQRETATSIY